MSRVTLRMMLCVISCALRKIFSFLSFQDMRTFTLNGDGAECDEVALVHKVVREYDSIKNNGPWTGSVQATISSTEGTEKHFITTGETVCHGSVNPLLFAFKESITRTTASLHLRFSNVTLSFTKITAHRP